MNARRCCFFLFFCIFALVGCASAPYKTSVQLEPQPGTTGASPQELDFAYNTAVSTGLDLGYRVVSSSAEERSASLNRLRSSDLVSETLEVSVESKEQTGVVNITYRSPKPLEETSVKEFTDRFMTKLKAKQAPPAAAPSPAPRKPRTDGDAKPPAAESKKTNHVILLKNGNVRAEPNMTGKILTTLKKGQVVDKLSESGDWYEVELPKGGKGWIAKRLVKEVE